MYKKLSAMFLVIVMCASVLVGCRTNDNKDVGKSGDEIVIGLSMSTLANDFFLTMQEEGEKIAKELNIKLVTLDAQDSSETQSEQIDDIIIQDVDLIIINPVDSDAIGTAVIEANNADIPVITVSRRSNSGVVVQHLDIDNKEAGQLIAEQLMADLENVGKIAVLEGSAGAPSAVDRQEGFLDTIKGESGLDVVISLTANYAREDASTVMEDILQSNPDIDAVYAHNDEMALGAVRTLKAANMEHVKVYGIDATDDAITAVENGEMAATVQQQPAIQIETAIKNALKVLGGEEVDERVDIPLKLITK